MSGFVSLGNDRLTFIVLEAELIWANMGQLQSPNRLSIVKMYENKFRVRHKVRVRHKISRVVKVRVKVTDTFKIRFYDFLAVPASDYHAELSPVHESSE